MLYLKVYVLACLLCLGTSWIKIASQPFVKIGNGRMGSSSLSSSTSNNINQITGTKLVEPNMQDMKVVAQILANITDYLYEKPGLAMKVVSDNMGWLYSRNVPMYVIDL